MNKSSSRRFPVTVSHLPVTRCQICHRTVAHQPGKASEVLTGHYRRAHPVPLEYSIWWLTCAAADGLGPVMVGWSECC